MKRPIPSKTVRLLALLSVLQAVGFTGISVYALFADTPAELDPYMFLLLPLTLVSIAGAIVGVALVRPFLQLEWRLRRTEQTIDELSSLNNTLRAQRHDFKNQLQVVYSLIELRQFDEAEAYIERVYDDIQKVSNVMKTSIPAVNAILEAKRRMCESRAIDVRIDVHTRLAASSIPAWELCRVFGNIIDNSIHILTENVPGEKRLHIELFENVRGYVFRITNNGPEIPEELRERIFEPGFTTRAERGEGMGLTICRRILTKYGGSLTVRSDSGETTFCGTFPAAAA